jgi:hypothetical protein
MLVSLKQELREAGLHELYERHAGKVSDKWSSYVDVYADIFEPLRSDPVRILEIGIQNGGSLELLDSFFTNARLILGCDVNPRCGDLVYRSDRISVIVGNSTLPDTISRVRRHSERFDIIIDDGSHKSRDIVANFARYFPMLEPGGLYVVEDLHCSYWGSHGGGFQRSDSSMEFLKRLCDAVNFEHWSDGRKPGSLLASFRRRYGIDLDDSELARIQNVSFYNSLTVIRKSRGSSNSLGRRIVVGTDALVDPRPMALAGGDLDWHTDVAEIRPPRPANDRGRSVSGWLRNLRRLAARIFRRASH